MGRSMARPSARPSRLTLTLLLACVAFAPLTPVARGQSRREPDDDKLRRAWTYLLKEEREDAIQRFTAESRSLGTFQNNLIRHALSLEEVDPGFYEEATPIGFFDPKDHAPEGRLKRRKLLKQRDRRVAPVHETILGAFTEHRLQPAFAYDWRTGTIVRTADPLDPKQIFESAIAGYPPGYDLAEAIVTKQLDDGSQRKALAAFEHLYADREGNVFPGVTLYDAWASATDLEMPDIDVLGIVHEITGERGRWVAPIPAEQHDELYAYVGSLFAPAHEHRGLRTALARTFLDGTPVLRDGYEFHVDRLHGLWEDASSSPAGLARALPPAGGWQDFLVTWATEFEKDEERVLAARNRCAALDKNRRQIRNLMIQILNDHGALERKRRPRPKPKAEGAKEE